MKSGMIKTSVVMLVLASAAMFFSSAAHADGKQIFLTAKCNKCHEGAGISLLPKDPNAEADDEAGEKKVEPTKLDGIGAALAKSWGSADKAKAGLPAYWAKEGTNPDGKKHKKKYVCCSDCGALIDWLLKL